MSTSGLNRVKRLQKDGIEIKEDRQAKKMALSQITIPTTGPLAHPRANAPIRQVLVDDIVENGILQPLTVWEQVGKDGKPVFLCVDGSRRKRAGHEAEKILRESGKLGKDEELWVKVEFFEGSEIEFLLARQKADGDPLKEHHVPSVIAATFIQILKLDPEYPIADEPAERDEEGNVTREGRPGLISTCPKDYNPRIVEALTRWKSLPKAVQDAFDNGIEIEGVVRPVPIGLLPGMDKFSNEDKLDALKELVAGGYKTFSGVTKFVNQKAFEEALASETSEDAEGEDAEHEAADQANGKARASTNGKPHESPGSFMIRKSACKRAYEHAVESKASADVIAFAAGAAFDKGLEIDTEGFPQRLLKFLEGMMWGRGVPGVSAPPEVKKALVKAPKEPKEPKEPKAKEKGKGKGKKGKKSEEATA